MHTLTRKNGKHIADGVKYDTLREALQAIWREEQHCKCEEIF